MHDVAADRDVRRIAAVTIPPPPPSLREIAEALGLDDALRLVEAHGGELLHIPSGAGSSSEAARQRFEDAFGKAMTKASIERFGGGPIYVPLCAGWRTLLYKARGMSNVAIARKLHCSYVTVSRRVNGDKRGNLDQLHLDLTPINAR